MFDPIPLGKNGERLVENGVQNPPRENSDKLEFNCSVGLHDGCGDDGYMEMKSVSATHNAIICPSCYLRVTIFKSVNTYEALRKCLEDRFQVSA